MERREVKTLVPYSMQWFRIHLHARAVIGETQVPHFEAARREGV